MQQQAQYRIGVRQAHPSPFALEQPAMPMQQQPFYPSYPQQAHSGASSRAEQLQQLERSASVHNNFHHNSQYSDSATSAAGSNGSTRRAGKLSAQQTQQPQQTQQAQAQSSARYLLHPWQWQPGLDTSSSRQFRGKESVEAKKWKSYLHPPLPASKQRTESNSSFASPSSASNPPHNGSHFSSLSPVPSAASSSAPSSRPSMLRYHKPIKPPLPELNRATYARYMSNTQPLLSSCIAGRRRCSMSIWRDELLKRKINPHAPLG